MAGYYACVAFILFCFCALISNIYRKNNFKKSKRKVLGVPQSQAAVLPRHQEGETVKTKQAQIEQTYEKH